LTLPPSSGGLLGQYEVVTGQFVAPPSTDPIAPTDKVEAAAMSWKLRRVHEYAEIALRIEENSEEVIVTIDDAREQDYGTKQSGI
jgi:ABC-type transporter lipoprotein component MlaA